MNKNDYPKFTQMPDELPLPNVTRQVVQKMMPTFTPTELPPSLCHVHSNLGLYFERYISYQATWELEKYTKTTLKWNKWEKAHEEKDDKYPCKAYLFDQLAERAPHLDDAPRQAYALRWHEMVKPAQPWQMTTAWRFVTGMGNKNGLEVGFTFHRVYGFPIIPGSSLKGLARAVALLEIAQQANYELIGLQEALTYLNPENKNDKKATPMQKLEAALLHQSYQDELKQVMGAENIANIETLAAQFRQIFGTQEQTGQAIFHESIPAARPNLVVDIMTVHYPDYYQDNKPPADTQSPIPIPFLTIEKTPFMFAIGWRGNSDPAAQEKAIALLKFGLMELGAGAKTAVGYGYFKG